MKVEAELKAAGIEYEYETIRIPFQRPTHYKPDYILANGIIVEVKGYFESDDRSKHLRVKADYPDLDIRFVFSNSAKTIGKKSTTTYAAWCEAKGFRYAEKSIPRGWLIEAPNRASLAAIANLRKSK